MFLDSWVWELFLFHLHFQLLQEFSPWKIVYGDLHTLWLENQVPMANIGLKIHRRCFLLACEVIVKNNFLWARLDQVKNYWGLGYDAFTTHTHMHTQAYVHTPTYLHIHAHTQKQEKKISTQNNFILLLFIFFLFLKHYGSYAKEKITRGCISSDFFHKQREVICFIFECQVVWLEVFMFSVLTIKSRPGVGQASTLLVSYIWSSQNDFSF